jgi:hypothetical protein
MACRTSPSTFSSSFVSSLSFSTTSSSSSPSSSSSTSSFRNVVVPWKADSQLVDYNNNNNDDTSSSCCPISTFDPTTAVVYPNVCSDDEANNLIHDIVHGHFRK